MWNSNKTEDPQAWARQFLKDYNAVVLDLERVKHSLKDAQTTFARFEAGLESCKDNRISIELLKDAVKDLEKQINNLEGNANEIRSSVSVLQSLVSKNQDWIAGEKEKQEQREEDGRSIRMNVINWVIPLAIAFLFGLVGDGLLRRYFPQAEPPLIENNQ